MFLWLICMNQIFRGKEYKVCNYFLSLLESQISQKCLSYHENHSSSWSSMSIFKWLIKELVKKGIREKLKHWDLGLELHQITKILLRTHQYYHRIDQANENLSLSYIRSFNIPQASLRWMINSYGILPKLIWWLDEAEPNMANLLELT